MLPQRSPMPSAAPCSAGRAGLERRDASTRRRSRDRCGRASRCRRRRRSSAITDFDEAHHRARAARRRVADGVGDAEARGAGADRGREQAAQRLGIGPRRVLGDVHHVERLPAPRTRSPPRSRFCRKSSVQPFGVLPDRARADEGAALDRHAGPLLNLGDRLDVGDHRPRRAVGADPQLAVDDRARQPLDVPARRAARRRAGRCRRCRCRAGPSGAGCRSSRRCDGARTDGDCSPSRSVSSSSIAIGRPGSGGRRDSSRRSADAALGAQGHLGWRRPARFTAAAGEEDGGSGGGRDPEAAGHRRTHPVVHVRRTPRRRPPARRRRCSRGRPPRSA